VLRPTYRLERFRNPLSLVADQTRRDKLHRRRWLYLMQIRGVGFDDAQSGGDFRDNDIFFLTCGLSTPALCRRPMRLRQFPGIEKGRLRYAEAAQILIRGVISSPGILIALNGSNALRLPEGLWFQLTELPEGQAKLSTLDSPEQESRGRDAGRASFAIWGLTWDIRPAE